MPEPIRILFIGNSYTYYNDLPSLFAEAAKADGRAVTVESVTKGGWSLAKMADPLDEAGQVVAERLTEGAHYDFVILQEQSSRPAEAPELFYDGVRALVPRIEAVGAKGILYQTWGRKEGCPLLRQFGWTPESMGRLLAESYRYIAKRCRLALSPVGDAFADVVAHHGDIELFDPDLSHPSLAGSLLALFCHYAAIFDTSPLALPYGSGLVDESTLSILKQAAHDAVFAQE